ncbi:hypothetical protein C1637_17475 [Chryseobacterium lactis]|uniref:Grasp-with-spasm system ATP-grasp peptide maturase n=1 Tax=Chryseobacterium lactis TaxID=1241981 RepID=A0A3G6RF21_CHRLC|nr:hypothetical protein [Chryseobacterium lactis]AZA82972.1 hypothetical protein EG342_14275 [Chryseobacterium lactis]AZB03355.1 hypothetical protein EG341_05140 [Chryseobacterium lactis]PNW12359.1 hypothetical protein C1637_17475 [Chryseobacterium lactis]
MILILSEKFDVPTKNVVSELKVQNADYQIICGADLLEKSFSIDIKKNLLYLNNKKIGNFNIVWYRRWLYSLFEFSNNAKEHEYLKREFGELSSNFMFNLSTKKWLNIPPFINPYPSKACQLKEARKCGLKIPNTMVTNNSSALKKFYLENKQNIISKNLSDPYFFKKNEEQYATYTTHVEKDDIESGKPLFFPSLFQNNIDKNIEIRAFYFLGQFYSYAIFSSNNVQTNIDYRIYDYNHPNRIMKYELPKHLKMKLTYLMEKLNLHTGSIDIIKNKNEDFYFLEVNPQGQFGGLKEYGLNIEKDIANYLIENDK